MQLKILWRTIRFAWICARKVKSKNRIGSYLYVSKLLRKQWIASPSHSFQNVTYFLLFSLIGNTDRHEYSDVDKSCRSAFTSKSTQIGLKLVGLNKCLQGSRLKDLGRTCITCAWHYKENKGFEKKPSRIWGPVGPTGPPKSAQKPACIKVLK